MHLCISKIWLLRETLFGVLSWLPAPYRFIWSPVQPSSFTRRGSSFTKKPQETAHSMWNSQAKFWDLNNNIPMNFTHFWSTDGGILNYEAEIYFGREEKRPTSRGTFRIYILSEWKSIKQSLLITQISAVRSVDICIMWKWQRKDVNV